MTSLIRSLCSAFVLTLLWTSDGQTATINAASCSRTDVVTAIGQAAPGDTVIVPSGDCTWSSTISITGITVKALIQSGTIIRGAGFVVTKHASQITRFANFRFLGNVQWINIGGSPSARPYVVDHNYFENNGGTLGHITANGGLFHHNTFFALSATSSDIFNIQTSENWSQAPSLGAADTTGERNIYFEDNTWTNVLETAIDSDIGTRLVIRSNTFTDSSLVFHSGQPNDTSPNGGHRHFEIYNNNFVRVSNSVAINKWIWVRGGSGVIANNVFARADSPDGFSFPNKSEIRLTLACPGSYPIQYQVGQTNQTPQGAPTQPLAIYGNIGPGASDSNFITVGSSDTGGGGFSCGNPSAYIQQGRDYVLSQTWAYTPYTYPHPLQAESGKQSNPPTSVNLQ